MAPSRAVLATGAWWPSRSDATPAVAGQNLYRKETPNFQTHPLKSRWVFCLSAVPEGKLEPTHERNRKWPKTKPARAAARGLDSFLRNVPEQVRDIRSPVSD